MPFWKSEVFCCFGWFVIYLVDQKEVESEVEGVWRVPWFKIEFVLFVTLCVCFVEKATAGTTAWCKYIPVTVCFAIQSTIDIT